MRPRSFHPCGRQLNLMHTNMQLSCWGKWTTEVYQSVWQRWLSNKNVLTVCAYMVSLAVVVFFFVNTNIWKYMKALQMRSSANAVYIAWHAFSLSVALHVQNLLPLLVVAACGGHAGSIFHIVFHLFPVVPSAVYTLPVPISYQRLPNDPLPGDACVCAWAIKARSMCVRRMKRWFS